MGKEGDLGWANGKSRERSVKEQSVQVFKNRPGGSCWSLGFQMMDGSAYVLLQGGNKMKSRNLVVFVLVCLVLVLTTSVQPASSQIKMVFETFLPPSAADTKVDQAYFKGLEEATGGQVKTELKLSASMGNPTQTLDRVLSGVSDTGNVLPGYIPGVFPSLELFLFPIDSSKHETVVRAMLAAKKKGWFDKDFANVIPLALSGPCEYVLFSKDKMTKVDQLKGKKLRAAGEVWSAASKAVGAVGVTMQTAEVYGAFTAGILNGAWWVWNAVSDYSLHEVTSYALPVNITCYVHLRTMNKNIWNKLPQSGKDYVSSKFEEYSLSLARAYDNDVSMNQKKFLSLPKNQMTAWDPGEIDKFGQALVPVWELWKTKAAAKGVPVQQYASDVWKTFQELGVARPFIGYTP